jgi:hypothetical protein
MRPRRVARQQLQLAIAKREPGNAESLGSSVWFILPDGFAVRVRLSQKV